MFKKRIKLAGALVISIILTLGLSISLQSVLAQWVAPVSSPPDGNMPPPIWSESGSSNWYLLNKPTWVGDNFTVSNWDSPGGEEPDFFVDTSDPNLPKIGIGTDVPQADLHIKGDGHMILEDTSLLLEFIDETDDNFRFYGNNNDILRLQADPGSTGAWNTTAMSIRSDGGVGIGTSNPNPYAKLSIDNENKYVDWASHNDLHNDLTISNSDAGITIISRDSSTGSSNLLLSEVEDNSSGDFEDSWAIWRTTEHTGSRFHIGYFDKSYSGYWGWGQYQAVTIGKNLNFGLHTGDYIPTHDLELWGNPNEPELMLVRDDSSVYQNNVLGEIWFDSRDGTISTVDGSAGIKAIASESHSSSDKGAHLAFFTKPTNRNYNQSAIERMRIDEAGNVGIGDTTPDYKLDVEGSCGGWASCNEDVAEVFPKQSSETIEPGDVVVLSGKDAKNLHKSSKPYDSGVAGIYSTDPGLLIRGEDGVALSVDPQDPSEFSPTQMPLALAGRVPVKATNENGNILKGDLLTTSSQPGRAMKCNIDTPEEKLQCMGAVLGKAMEDCDQSECTILAIVTLQ